LQQMKRLSCRLSGARYSGVEAGEVNHYAHSIAAHEQPENDI
jgi:hypothetical protein